MVSLTVLGVFDGDGGSGWKLDVVDAGGWSRTHAGTPNMRINTHGVADHANASRDTQKIVSIRPADPEPSDLPTGSATCLDLPDEPERATQTRRTCAGKHTVMRTARDSRKPSKASAILDLPARGTVSRMGEPERPRD